MSVTTITRDGRTRAGIAIIIASALFVSGCSANLRPGLPPSFAAMQPPPGMTEAFEKLEREGERNWVLNLHSLAYAALRNGDRDLAKQALDEAILQIEVIYGDSAQAQRARNIFNEESSKIFKGDPYERSMIYFYRGVLYMQDREWDNARACFRSAQIQDAFAEESQSQADWTLFDYLIGVCEIQLGDEDAARDAFRLASQTYSGFGGRYNLLSDFESRNTLRRSDLNLAPELIPFDPGSNLLVLTQHGYAPRKVPEGRFGEAQGYRPGGSTDAAARIVVDGQAMGHSWPVDSVYYQAATRGGREIDSVLGRKATFRGAGEDVGEAGIYAGSALVLAGASNDNGELAAAGLATMALGALSYGLSSLVKPAADVRAMKTLPDWIGLYAGNFPEGEHEVGVQYIGVTRSLPGGDASSARVHLEEDDLEVLLAFPPPQSFIVTDGDSFTTNTQGIGIIVQEMN